MENYEKTQIGQRSKAAARASHGRVAKWAWQSHGCPLTLPALPFGIQVVGRRHGIGGGEGPALRDCHQNWAVPGISAAKPERKQASFDTVKSFKGRS